MILDNILKFLINPKSKIKVCGDIDVNYHINSNRKYQLNALQNSYNLIDTVDFQQECNTHSFIHSFIYLVFQRSTEVDIELVRYKQYITQKESLQ